MKLINPLEEHLMEMMSWFSSQKELSDWAGPGFRYPFEKFSFVEDLNLHKLNSFSLISEEGEFLAFGQYYLRLGKCHLGRLIVSPKYRGKGIANELLNRLSTDGLIDLQVLEISLFVLTHNEAAIKAYEKFGFVISEYPEEIQLENCIYMIKN